MHSQNFLSPHTQTIWGTSMFKGLSIEEAWLMAVESAALALLPLWHSDPVVRVPLTCLFLSNLNGTFNMTRQTKQIKPMISRSREPDQTRSQRADLMICRQKRVGQGESLPFLFIVSLHIWKCNRHQDSLQQLWTVFLKNPYVWPTIPTLAHNPSLDTWLRTIEVLAEDHTSPSRYLTHFFHV